MSLFDTQPIELHVSLSGHARLDFDKKQVRKALRKGAGEIRQAARRMVARRVISAAGDYPGKQAGVLQRSIKFKTGSSGFWVKVAPYRTEEMGADFYPAYLWYGTKGKAASGYAVEPRRNYMSDALDAKRENVRAALRAALQNSLVPRKL